MIPVVFAVAFAGVLAKGLLPASVEDADTAILHLAKLATSPLWTGVLIAALLAAVMSSADTCLLTISTLVSRDLAGTLRRKPASERRILVESRAIIAVAGILSLIIALRLQDIVAALMICYKLYSPAVLAPFLALVIFHGHRFSAWSGLLAVVLGAGFAALGLYLGRESLQLAAFGVSALPPAVDVFLNRKRQSAAAS